MRVRFRLRTILVPVAVLAVVMQAALSWAIAIVGGFVAGVLLWFGLDWVLTRLLAG
jgi:hypothetical protein